MGTTDLRLICDPAPKGVGAGSPLDVNIPAEGKPRPED